jgi:hypothetical protein
MGQTAFLENQIVSLASSFNRSTNLELDYKSGKKLSDIYLTQKFSHGAIDILQTINEENSNQRVRVLSGSPGLGKSTFAYFMSTLVAKKNPKIIKTMINKSEVNNKKELLKTFETFQKSRGNKLLPVFLNGYIGNIEDAFLSKLLEAFTEIGLEKELNKVIKDSSKKYWSIISGWEKKYPEIYGKYLEELEREVDDQKDFEASLKKGKVSSREIFERIYANVTGGSSLTSKSNNDVVAIFKKANEILKENGFSGIFVVYDEFGKYLERGIHNPSALNIQFLQDFAEYCDRSGDKQCHLTLITHLSVSQYATQLPINIQKEWAKIEGRFHETSFYDRGTNSYDMIGHVFEKTVSESSPALAKKVKKFSTDFIKDIKKIGLTGFADQKNIDSKVLECYPLHPVTLAFLPMLSQKVAQNERTLYTFLTRDEEHSLKRFLDNGISSEKLEFLMPLDLFNYFAPIIAKDVGVGGSYKINLIVEEAFGKIKNDDIISKQIVSLVALSSIIKNYNIAPLTKDFITAVFNGIYSAAEIKKSLEELTRLKIFFFNKVLKQYELQQGSSIDIDEEINKFREIKLTSKDLVRIVKNYYKKDFLVPKRYNYQHKITRFYKSELLSVEELKSKKFTIQPDYYREDGIVYYVVPFDQDELDIARKLVREFSNEMIVFVLPKSFVECKRDIEELNAINTLYGNKEIINSGPLVKKELDKHKDVTLKAIKSVLDPLIGKFNLDAEVFYSKIEMRDSVQSYTELLISLGSIFEEEYSEYVTFNNEMLNKHKVSGNISLARKQIIDNLSHHADKNMLGMEGNGPEVSIYKSLKKASGLKYDSDSLLYKISKKSDFNKLFKNYKKLLTDYQYGLSGEKLYNTLVAPPYGLRKGVIPLFTALFDKSLEHPINHYFDSEFIPFPDGDHYDLVLKHPKNCFIKYSEISKEKSEFLKALAEVFNVKESKPTVSSVIEGILKWKSTVPDYTKNSGKLSVEEKKLLIHIDSAKEPDTLIFKQIPEDFGFLPIHEKTSKRDIESLKNALYEAKDHIFSVYPSLIKSLHGKLVMAAQFIQVNCLSQEPVEYKKGMNLAKIFQETFKKLPDEIQNYPFNKLTAKVIGRLRSFDSSKHPQYFVETMGDALTESNPRNWAEKGASLFETSLTKCLNEIEMVTELLDSEFKGQSVVAFINKESGDKEYLRLGVYSEVKEAKIIDELEKILDGIDNKTRNNILLSLLKPSEDINSSVEIKDIKGKYIE